VGQSAALYNILPNLAYVHDFAQNTTAAYFGLVSGRLPAKDKFAKIGIWSKCVEHAYFCTNLEYAYAPWHDIGNVERATSIEMGSRGVIAN
jgi:hypothetical protein